MGVDRVLTSGGRPTAMEGVETLRSLVERSAGRIAVMAGGRLALDHLEALIRPSGVREIHLGSAACRSVEGRRPAASEPDDRGVADGCRDSMPLRGAGRGATCVQRVLGLLTADHR